MAGSTSGLELREALPDPQFGEFHSRKVDLPIEAVWPACLSVPASELRTLAPLMVLRGLPALMRGRRALSLSGPSPLLEVFAGVGFIVLRQDEHPVDGRAITILGAIGKFWHPAHNAPLVLDGPQAFLDFDEPGYAKTAVRLEAETDDGRTRIETETLIAGTDRVASRKFALYWALIRLPSGLIRRDWLAAIDRHAHRAPAD